LSETLHIIKSFVFLGRDPFSLFFRVVTRACIKRTHTHIKDEEQNHVRVVMAGVSIIPRILLRARIRCPRRRVRPQGKVILRLIAFCVSALFPPNEEIQMEKDARDKKEASASRLMRAQRRARARAVTKNASILLFCSLMEASGVFSSLSL